MKYQLYYEEGGQRTNVRVFNAATRTEALAVIRPLNIKHNGWRSYFFEEIEEQQKPVIRRVVAV